MADIVWAAHRIDDNKVVRRQTWLYEERWDGLRKKSPNDPTLMGRVGLTLEDLLADDWEIAE